MKFTDREWGLIKDFMPEDEDTFTVVLDAVMKMHALENASLLSTAKPTQEKQEKRIALLESKEEESVQEINPAPDAEPEPEPDFSGILSGALSSFA